MSEKPIDDGGPAFPSHVTTNHKGDYVVSWVKGMTLRDYFAAKAMQAMVSSYQEHNVVAPNPKDDEGVMNFTKPDCEGLFIDSKCGCAVIASTAYEMADAMLKARKEPNS